MTEIMPVPRNSHITVLRPPSIIGGFFTLYESMISTVGDSGFLKILQYTFYMLLGAQIFLLNLSPFYFAVGLQWSPRVKNIPIIHHFQKKSIGTIFHWHLKLHIFFCQGAILVSSTLSVYLLISFFFHQTIWKPAFFIRLFFFTTLSARDIEHPFSNQILTSSRHPILHL